MIYRINYLYYIGNMMIKLKNILVENMRRFGTKNLNEDFDQNNNGYPDNTEKLNISNIIHSQIKDLKTGDEIIIHKPSQNGEGINTRVIFLKYNSWWDWIVVKKDGKELKVSVIQDPQEDEIFIEKL